MNQITITIWIDPESMTLMMQHFRILEDAPLINAYVFQVKDVHFSVSPTTGFLTVNVPVDLWSTFMCKYKSLQNS